MLEASMLVRTAAIRLCPLVTSLVLFACDGGRATGASAGENVGVASAITAPASADGAPSWVPGLEASSPPPPAPSVCAPSASVFAPSLAMDGALDQRSSAALARCLSLRSGQEKLALECGQHDPPPIDLERIQASAVALDVETIAHVVRVARRGKLLERNPHVFGIVGDSVSVSADFLWAFGHDAKSAATVDPPVDHLLLLESGESGESGESVVDWFRGAEAERVAGVPVDSFRAWRAARVGARASWATEGGEASPVAELVSRLDPAIAIVTYGANDAAYSASPPEDLAREFEKNLVAIIDALEAKGVVVIVSNEMRHADQPGVKACPRDDPRANDWHISIAQNATSARAAEVAARWHLPFVDVRYALETATNHGLGPDGVHPNVFHLGGGQLTREGLDCGHNRRNAVTLLELRRVVDALVGAGVFPSPAHDSSSHTTPPSR